MIPDMLCWNYMDSLVGRFFKILPLKEEELETLGTYMISLQTELIGASHVMRALAYDARYLSLIATLQFLIDKADTCDVDTVKREVFKSISICKKLRDEYSEEAFK